MKRIASHLCTLLVGMVAVAGHFMCNSQDLI